MSTWKGKCSQLGDHWAVEVAPGSDTSFKEVIPGIPPCFGEKDTLEFIRKMDVLGPIDGANFSVNMIVDLDTYRMRPIAESHIEFDLPQDAKALLGEEIVKFISDKKVQAVLGGKTGIDLWTVSEIYTSDSMKNLDSTIVSLYTKVNDRVDATQSYWVVGTKNVPEALGCVEKLVFEGQIPLKNSLFVMNNKAYIIIRIDSQVDAKALIKTGFYISAEKTNSVKCKLGSSILIAFGWALQGYGIGGYGQ